jgi:hypothetical protein
VDRRQKLGRHRHPELRHQNQDVERHRHQPDDQDHLGEHLDHRDVRLDHRHQLVVDHLGADLDGRLKRMGCCLPGEPSGEECPGWPRTGCCPGAECRLGQPKVRLEEQLETQPLSGLLALPEQVLLERLQPEPQVLASVLPFLPQALVLHLGTLREVSSQPVELRWMIHP